MLKRALPRGGVPAPHVACLVLVESPALGQALQRWAAQTYSSAPAAAPLPVLRLLRGDLGRGFSASALSHCHGPPGAQLRRRLATARQLHSSAAGLASQDQAKRQPPAADAPARELHTSASTSAREEGDAPREVRRRTPHLRQGVAPRAACSLAPLAQALNVGDLAEVRAEATRSVKEARAAEDGWARAAVTASKGATAWLLTVPAKLHGLRRMSRAEWATMLSGIWAAIKKEAHHFWARAGLRSLALLRCCLRTHAALQVGSKLLYAEMQISGRLIGNVVKGHPLSR